MVNAQTPSFCPKCGTGIAPNDRFCRSCGLDLTALAATADAGASGSASPSQPSTWGTEPTWRSLAPEPAAVDLTVATPVQPAEPVASPAKRRRTPFVVGLAAVAVIAVGAVALATGAIQTPVNTHTINGTFEITDSSAGLDTSGVGCKGDGGYGDIGPGTNVTVKDEKGVLLDTASLGTGSGTSSDCTFKFTLTVPDVAKFYTFEVGRRGALSYSHDDMVTQGWTVGMTLGS